MRNLRSILLIVLMFTNILDNPLSAVTGWLYERFFFLAEMTFSLAQNIF